MRVTVLSATQFGRECIVRAIVPCPEAELAGVVTTEPTTPISYQPGGLQIATHASFAELGESLRCPVAVLPRVGTEPLLEVLRPQSPDLILVLGWYHMVRRPVREIAAVGTLGIHASLLPRYRGGAPIPWAIINGESETGVTLFHLADGVDDGDVVAQRAVAIGPEETWVDVYARATDASIAMLAEMLPQLAAGTAPRIAQDHALATEFPQRGPEDGRIDWRCTARQVHDLVRAVTRPYPGAFCDTDAGRLRVWAAAPAGRVAGGAGTVRIREQACWVACGDGAAVELRDVQLPDGTAVTGAAAAAGLGWRDGDVLPPAVPGGA